MIDSKNEQQLVKLLQKGNVEAFDSLFGAYSSKLFGFAFKYFRNESDAEELVQEVFVKVWENRQSLKSEYSFRSYLFTIALNQIRKYYNKKAASLRYLESLSAETFTSEAGNNENYELALQKLNSIIDTMPPRRREIFIKSKLEGKSSKEIASELNITPGTVDNQVSEAIRFIRNQMKTENIDLVLFMVLFVN